MVPYVWSFKGDDSWEKWTLPWLGYTTREYQNLCQKLERRRHILLHTSQRQNTAFNWAAHVTIPWHSQPFLCLCFLTRQTHPLHHLITRKKIFCYYHFEPTCLKSEFLKCDQKMVETILYFVFFKALSATYCHMVLTQQC